MLEVLSFAFQSFWHFIGVLILAGIVFEGVAKIIHAFVPTRDKHIHYHINGKEMSAKEVGAYIKMEDGDE